MQWTLMIIGFSIAVVLLVFFLAYSVLSLEERRPSVENQQRPGRADILLQNRLPHLQLQNLFGNQGEE